MYDCIVVGAGISGLSAAYALHRRGARLLVIEARDHAGGSMRSEQTSDGFAMEHGPNTVVSNNIDMDEHFAELGLSDDLLVAHRDGARRYILLNGKPELIPTSPPALVQSPLLSPMGKLRMLAEPLLPRSPMNDESIVSFFTRRLGSEPASRLIDPFVSGVYAGDPTTLSVRATFPSLWEAEQAAGSIVLGMIVGAVRKKRPEGRKRSQMISFRHGLQTWPQAIIRTIGEDHVWLSTSATALEPADRAWNLTLLRNGTPQTVQTRRIILATPADVVANLIERLDEHAAAFLRTIPYPPLAVVHLGYRRSDVAHPLDGFGVLCPSRERREVLGTLWPSTLFAQRAPEGAVLLTSFIGGARRPELATQDEEALIALAMREQQAIVGAQGTPILTRAIRWDRAIPQYVAGHSDRITALNRLEAMWPGLYLLGNYRDGVSVEKCWHKGKALGETIPIMATAEATPQP